MARMLGQPSSDGSYWTIDLHSTNLSPCPSPEGGLLKFDLHVKVKHTCRNPSSSQSQLFFHFNFPTLRLFSTTLMNRAQYSSALHQWLRQLLPADVANDVTDHVIEHLFHNIINPTTLHEISAFHVQIDLNCVSNASLEELDHDPVDEIDDVAGPATGLSEFFILLVMTMSEFPAPAKEELECRGLRDCSICLDDLVSGGGEETKTNDLFESRLCGHVFHGECMKKWLRISDSCPLCRLVLSSESKRIMEEIIGSYRME